MTPVPPHCRRQNAALEIEAGLNHTNDENNIIIAVMGPAGAGKSLFVNTAVGRTEVTIGDGLKSQTREVWAIRCTLPNCRQNIVLVDTPGFDDRYTTDSQILRAIAKWLKVTYQSNIKLAGILYLHPITNVKWSGTPLRNLKLFEDLCGEGNLKNIILVTTMWDEIENLSVADEREEELRSIHWKDMIYIGSQTFRFERSHESALNIINRLNLESSRRTLAPLREMVDGKTPFKIFRRLCKGSHCCGFNYRGALAGLITALRLAHQMADIVGVPFLRGSIGIVLQIAELVEGMDGTHHMIILLIEQLKWLLDEIQAHCTGEYSLSESMKTTLKIFEEQLKDLQYVVKTISSRSKVSRFFWYDADIQTLTVCTTAIKAIYDKFQIRLTLDTREAIAHLQNQFSALELEMKKPATRQGTEAEDGMHQQQCAKCGEPIILKGSLGGGQASQSS